MNASASADALPAASTSPVRAVALGAVVVLFAATWIHPIWPVEQALHGSLTIVAFGLLFAFARRPWTRDRDIVLLCVFLALHCIASRWLYSNVPYDAWCRAILNFSPQSTFGWSRNHFDRLVHFAYGVCVTPALASGLRHRYPLSPRQAFALAVLLVMGSSLVYEWIEWGVALTLSPRDAEAYNGQQGDMWDAHADMLLATVGSLIHGSWMVRRDASRPA